MSRKLILCKPNGFCAGVDRAVKMVELALEAYGAPIYVNHEIVHNRHVVARLAELGAVFVRESLDEVPEGARLIYSAHGVPPALRAHAARRRLRELDATCPLVTKVHLEAVRFARKGYHIFLIGHADHVEVEGTRGEVPESITVVEPHRGPALDQAIAALPEPPTDKLIFLTQTTLNVDDCLAVVDRLRARWPALEAPPSDDICYATTNRQNAVKAVAAQADFVVVVGSPNSSNSRRLVEVARESGCAAELFGGAADLAHFDFSPYRAVAVTAGASSPAELVEAVLETLRRQGFDDFETFHHVHEDTHFQIPREFRKDLADKGIAV